MMRAITLVLFGVVLFPLVATAQSTWEITPYKVNIWWVASDAPELPASWKTRLATSLERQLRPVFAGVSQTTVAPAPENVQLWMKRDLRSLTREKLFESDPELSKVDKLFLLVVDAHRQSYSVRLLEFDCLLTHLGPVDVQSVSLLQQVAPRAVEMISESFSPVVRIERAADGMVKTRLRAGALLQSDDSPVALHANDVLLPYDRRVKNTGSVNLKNIRPIDWTYIRVPTGGGAKQSVRDLDIVSGFRQPFRSKRSRRLQQYAIRTRPPSNQSKIRLLGRTNKEALAGYEIHEKGDEVTLSLIHISDPRD